MREIADKIGAYLFVDMAHVAGLIAAGVCPNPVPHAHVVTSTTHKTLAGPRGGLILSAADDEDLHKKLGSAVFPGGQGGPLMHVIAGKAVAFKEALEPEFKTYQAQVVKNAKAMAATFIERGYKIVSGGTDNHLMLVDLIGRELTGKDADAASARPTSPSTRTPYRTTRVPVRDLRRAYRHPAITRRGFQTESIQLANWICDVLDSHDNEEVLATVREKVLDICRRFRSTHNQPDLQVETNATLGWHCFCSVWQDETEVTMCDDMKRTRWRRHCGRRFAPSTTFAPANRAGWPGMCAA